MMNIKFLFLVFGITISYAQLKIVIPANTKIFAEPNDSSKIIYFTEKQETLQVYDEIGNWRQVLYKDNVGWIRKFRSIVLYNDSSKTSDNNKITGTYSEGYLNGKRDAENSHEKSIAGYSCVLGGLLGVLGTVIAYNHADNVLISNKKI
ncbi:hypothetical protein J7M00_00125, partial [bacterium]|nr:hypothetical protein [bacterium]